MSFEQVIQLISNTAFPISMCILMCLYVNKLQEQHKAESKEFTEALESVRLVLEQLKTILERRGQ
jgi:hypothetical protein